MPEEEGEAEKEEEEETTNSEWERTEEIGRSREEKKRM